MVVEQYCYCEDELAECMDDGHALVLEGFFYGTGVNITCLKQFCLFTAPLRKSVGK